MGNVGSRIDDSGSLFFKDQNKFTISNITITNARRRVLLNVAPNSFPATRYIAKRDAGDDRPVEYVQDPDPPASAPVPSFLLRLNNEDELWFNFTFIVRQTQTGNVLNSTVNGVSTSLPETIDTTLTGLTFAHASNVKELDNLITREFHANPNLQNNSNVQLIGDYSTKGSPSIQFEWSWKWKPPKAAEDRGGGWRNSCSFLDYDQRANRLNTLINVSFWVHNALRPLPSPQMSPQNLDVGVSARNRIPSSQSVLSHSSDAEGPAGSAVRPSSPPEGTDNAPPPATAPPVPVKVDLPYRQGEDMSAVEDGPLFRATMKALEQKTGSMRIKIKKVLKKAEAAHQAQTAYNDAVSAFISALEDASSSNANAIQPAMEHYFEKIARQILNYEQQNAHHLQKLIIDPLYKLYNNDIKQAEAKKKDFEEESRDYYAYVGRYLGQRQDSLKEKKRAESDSKYQAKRRNFELKRFDYSSFMQDLHGGRKEQEVLSHLTKYAEKQTRDFLATARKVEEMIPQLEALIREVDQADKEFQFQRTEREEKRRALEKSTKAYVEPDTFSNPTATGTANSGQGAESELSRADSTGSQIRSVNSNTSSISSQTNMAFSPPGGVNMTTTANPAKFKGIRDLEERDGSSVAGSDKLAGPQRKEGLLWALSRPGSHIDPKGINKQAWHKFWIVLDQGKLSEYSNWKQKLDLHMDPIDLRMASVREARNAERRFCFEVITPQFKRIYQATSEEDMSNWITAINNALQSAVEGRNAPPPAVHNDNTPMRDIGSVLTGKSSSYSGQHSHSTSSNASSVNRRTTVGARPMYSRGENNSFEENPAKLLQMIRDADQGNKWCADCGSTVKVEWVSINLGIVLCIECSGIHRSLGTHISKVRSLTLDVNSFSSDIVEILLQIGNRVSNMVWEATLDQSQKPLPQSTREQRLKFITAKYSDRAYVQPLSPTKSHYTTPDETLLASIKKNDIQGVLYGIALRANVNVTDRSRNTHAVFLALAAADPASPGSTATGSNGPAKVIPFPIAELLVQNGAEIPSQPPPIPLSPAAQLYLSQRTAVVSGGYATPAASSTGKSSNDTLTSLPSIRGNSGTETSGTHSAAHALAPLDNKEREKLQKRGSAGARFAGKVASLGVDR
ncbi:ARF GTPase activator (Csx2) [Rasamsonia emersonii CBS 393.64]|uniref:ADP-ribosylation factor GTPase-activating protein n=1 Tax=Rasamsonia emersonii (strain ATCC 16479 / CBS 393.64 / IMI 116815) TaxID=1408163 RepID=A0A0F4YU36_RASE3|nr:ARF GTPase activator (Csx2) [Rasamsonia emersonii CBS 393.64]KKA21128.1 ARF GTPase activator (Csx2) [Rasamsonia emersonii CBS 393.64]